MSIAVGFLLVPITINYVNPTKFGVWLILSSIVNWFNFFDVGLANGLKNKISEANAFKDSITSRIYLSSAYAILSIISVLLFLLLWIANHFLNWNSILNISYKSLNNLKDLVMIIFSIFCIQFVSQIINVVLAGLHATFKVSIISFISQFSCLITIYILTKLTSGSLIYLILGLGAIPLLIQVIASVWLYTNEYKYLMPSFSLVNFKYAKELLNTGGYFFLIQIGSLLLFETDNIVITQIFGPAQVTTFNIAFKLFTVIISIFTIVMTPFWSAFTDAYVKNDLDWIKSIFKTIYKYWLVLVFCCALLCLISRFIYQIWLPQNFYVPISLTVTMALYSVGFCWMMIHCYLLNGINKIRLQLYLYIISTVINIPISILLGRWLGLYGVTMSNVIVLFYMGVILYIQCKNILNESAKGVWNS